MNFTNVKNVAEKVLGRRYASPDLNDKGIKLHSHELKGVDSIYTYSRNDVFTQILEPHAQNYNIWVITTRTQVYEYS